MMKKLTWLMVFCSATIFGLSGCGGGGSSNNGPSLNSDPISHAGSNQNVTTGSIVTLDGSGSSDPDGDLLTFLWSFTSKPVGSLATLSDDKSVKPTFNADLDGEYVVQLTVDDGTMAVLSSPVTVTASSTNSAPTANAGSDQNAATGSIIALDGSGSSDADGDLMTYSWSFTLRPNGSTAVLSSTTAVNPTFTADLDGSYILQLIVNDGTVDSQPDTVAITAETSNSTPVANAGSDQNVATGSVVALDGSGSSDADGDPLTYNWSFTTRPDGSSATLSDPAAASPTFAADLTGNYVLTLIVSDGQSFSQADSITITVEPPLAVTTVTSSTGKVWMDRNLGASRVATSFNDAEAFGDLYQWGRGTDGHEKRTSLTTTTLSSSDTPGHGDFIVAPDNPRDWRSPQNDTLWQGVSGTNNPCPSGFRLPTSAEWEAELTALSITNSASALASPLKLVSAGLRRNDDGAIVGASSVGRYRSSSVSGSGALILGFASGFADASGGAQRASGFSARCLKD